MAAVTETGLFGILFCCCLQLINGETYCYYRYYYRQYYCYYYMEDGSVGGLVAGLVVLAIIVAVVVFLLKAKYNRSRVVAISGGGGTAVHVNTTNTINHGPPPHPVHGYGPSQPGYGAPQPGYGYPPQQPMYGGGNPAYPPGQIY